MSNMPEKSGPLDTRLSAHDDEVAAVEAVRLALARPEKTKATVEEAIARLCELIEKQFAREEEGGYMRAIVEQAPRFRSQIDKLLAGHQELVDRGEKLRLLIHSGMDMPSWWSCVQADFEQFADHLSQHHHAEIKVMQEAFSQDLGSGD